LKYRLSNTKCADSLIKSVSRHNCEACRTSLGMLPGEGPEAGKHDEKIQANWFQEMGRYVLKDGPSGCWAHITDDKVLGPIIQNCVNKVSMGACMDYANKSSVRCKKNFFKVQKMIGTMGEGLILKMSWMGTWGTFGVCGRSCCGDTLANTPYR
jgi:hypothetical protein